MSIKSEHAHTVPADVLRVSKAAFVKGLALRDSICATALNARSSKAFEHLMRLKMFVASSSIKGSVEPRVFRDRQLLYLVLTIH